MEKNDYPNNYFRPKPTRKNKLKYLKRSITRSQFHALIQKAAQPLE